MPTVQINTRVQADLSSNREKLDFAANIALLEADEAPFTAILNKFPRVMTGNRTRRWLDDEVQPEVVTSAAQTNQNASSVTLTVTAGFGLRLAKGDLLRHNTSGEVLLVTAVSTDAITVTRNYGQGDSTPGYTTRLATILTGAYLTIIGNAFMQGHLLPGIKNTKEIERLNHTQEQRTPLGVSETVIASDLYGEQEWPYEIRKKRTEHHRRLEFQHLYGVPVQGTKAIADATNTAPAAAAGLDFYISEYASADKKTNVGGDITQQEFLNHLESAFQYSSQLVCFTPRKLRFAIDFWGLSKINTFVGGTAFGMKVVRWDTNDGSVIFVTERLNRDPLGTDGVRAHFVNMDNVALVYFNNIGPTRFRNLMSYEADGSTVKKSEWTTISALQVRLIDTHSLISNITSYSA